MSVSVTGVAINAPAGGGFSPQFRQYTNPADFVFEESGVPGNVLTNVVVNVAITDLQQGVALIQWEVQGDWTIAPIGTSFTSITQPSDVALDTRIQGGQFAGQGPPGVGSVILLQASYSAQTPGLNTFFFLNQDLPIPQTMNLVIVQGWIQYA